MSLTYNRGRKALITGEVIIGITPLKAMMIDYAGEFYPDKDDDFVSNIVADESSGTGYERKTLTTVAATENDTDDAIYLTANNLTYSGLDCGTVKGLIVYAEISAEDDTQNILLGWYDGGFPIITNGGNININWNTKGFMEVK
jgi:hypothetical protein